MIYPKETPQEIIEIDHKIHKLNKCKDEIYSAISKQIIEKSPIAYIKKNVVFSGVYGHTIGSQCPNRGNSREFCAGDQIRIIDSWKTNKKNLRTNYIGYWAGNDERYPGLFIFNEKDGQEKYISFDKPNEQIYVS